MDILPYEYVCWKNIFLDIEVKEPKCNISSKTLTRDEIVKISQFDFVQHWFYDTDTSEEFKAFIDKLNSQMRANEFNIDLDKFVEENYNRVYTEKEIILWNKRFYFAAYLSEIDAKNSESQLLQSLIDNKEFLTNILRKSIYEYYVRQRWIITNSKNTKSMFEKKHEDNSLGFELIQVDMIISSVENKWVK